jgi:predicted nucleotidyltransferase
MPLGPSLHRLVAAQPYSLLLATISGAHLHGFPSPDLDFDRRGAHEVSVALTRLVRSKTEFSATTLT